MRWPFFKQPEKEKLYSTYHVNILFSSRFVHRIFPLLLLANSSEGFEAVSLALPRSARHSIGKKERNKQAEVLIENWDER